MQTLWYCFFIFGKMFSLYYSHFCFDIHRVHGLLLFKPTGNIYMDINSISVLFSTFMIFFIHSLRMLLAYGENKQMLLTIMIYSRFNIRLLLVLAIRKKRFVLLLKERDPYDSKSRQF